jgi:hypothetical protein
MAYLCTYKCASIEFDVFDSNRISVADRKSNYYITPSLLAKIEEWLIINNKEKIHSKEDIEFLISNKLIGVFNI